MPLVIVLLFLLLVLRVFYRTWLNFPPAFGPSLLQEANADKRMDEDRFWALIARSREISGGNYDHQIEALTDMLEGERLPDIIAFHRTFVAFHNSANHFKYWECAYALNWGCSDDGFDYFRTWWIAQGKNKFYWSMRFPRLLFFFAVREAQQHYEGLEYCAGEAYENLTQREMPREDIEYADTRGKMFSEGLAIIKHPGLAFLAW